MSDCRKCARWEECLDLEDCGLFVKKRMTNADRIRVMTDEELADYLRWHNGLYSRNGMDWLDWLKKEVEDATND